MPHALTIHREVVALRNRAQYFERLRAKLAYYTAASCRFWVFEEISLPGAFIEFTEADTAQTLAAAHASAPWRLLDPGRIYQQVEIV
jgi:hypothetical protein